jgi:hypothetical protein
VITTGSILPVDGDRPTQEQLTPNAEGIMTTEGIPRPLRWKGLYHVAMLESDRTKLPSLLDDAVNAVLDQIEETLTHGELEELNTALNGLRSRRKEANSLKRGRDHSPNQTTTAKKL